MLIAYLLSMNRSLILLVMNRYETIATLCAELINQYDNVIIVHSFTKFYAVPGLRIGAVFANPTLIQELLFNIFLHGL